MQVLKSLVALLGKPVFRLMLLLCSFVATAQHSNVVISTAANANGSWVLSGSTYTFTPTADNAVINNVTLQTYLRNYSVEIKTARAAGTQVGSVVFDVGVSADKNSSSSSAFVFTITSGGEVQFNASLSLRNPNYSYNTGYNVVVTAGGNVRVGGVLDVSGYSNADGYNTFPSPGSVSMVVGGDLVVSGTGQVLSKGINNMYSSMNNANGGVGGLQSYVVSGGIDLQVGSVLNAGGGNGYITSYYNTTGGTGGSITLSAVNGVLMRGSVQSMGGNGYRGGTGGVLSVSSSSSWVDYSGVLSSQGGNGFNSGYQSGNGGNISISGFGGLSLRGDVNASVGSVGTGTSGGSISLSDGNGVLTSGGGVNDGLVGGVLKGVNVTKLGVGVFGLGGANAYTGSTTVSAGKIYLLQSESIPNLSALSLAASTELDMGGVSESVGSLAGSGKVTSSVTGSILLTVGSDNTTTSYSGILEDGLGVLRVTKAGTGTWSVSGVNTYSGLTQVLAGVLSIGNSSGLGAVSSGTEVTSGASLELYGGVSVGAEPLSLLGIGRSSIGALRNLSGVNAYAGAITVGTGVRVNVNGGSLNLTAGSVFTGDNASMLFGGSGLLSVGGVMSLGSGAITHDGTGSVYLLADNVYSGLTRVSGNGTLRVGSSGALGATSSGVEVIGSGVLELIGGISVLGESLSLAGYGNGVVGGFRNVSGNNVWSGTVSLTGNSGLGSGSGKLSLTGSPAIAASSFGVKIYGVVGSSVELVGEALYTGQTELVSGSLLLGASERIADGSNVMFNGGDLSTAGYSETLGELSLYAASSISLGVGVHALRFSGAGVYDFKMLTIKGWQGVYGTPGSSGTAGKVYVGTSAGLNRERLDQTRFYNSTGPATHYCLQLSSGELVAGANITLVTAHSNIRITANATSNGSWSSVGNLVTFTTSADNANINATELQNYLRSFSVEIKTARAAGTQVGSVVFDTGVSADKNSSSSSAFVFTITSGGEVQFNASLSLRNPNYSYNTGYNVVVTAGGNVRVGGVLDVSGYSNADGYNTFPSPGSVSMVVGGDLVVSGTGQVLSKGINNMYSSMNNANGGVGGLQSYVVSGGIDLQVGSVLNAGGGNGYITSYYNTTGGTGGSITLSAVNGVLMRGSVQSMGGNGYRGGTGGVLSVSSSSSWVDYSGVLSSQGGNGFNSGYQSGNGGNISISGFGGLSLRGDVNASVGSVGTGTSGGSISLSDGNGVLTSGGGVNDGLVGGVLKGVNVTKLGVGVFGLGGANAYTGSTTVSAGKIYLLQSESIPNLSALSLAASTELDMGGVSESVGSLAGSGKVTSSVTGSILLTVGSDNTTTSYSGILEDGLGVLRVTKAGTGTWSVSGVNTYSGLTQVLAGVLSIGNSSGLGAVSSGTEVTSGASLELYGGVSVGAEPLSLLGIGRSSIGALRNLSGVNAYAGAITVGTGVRVNVNGGSLNLTAGSVFTGTDASMLFGGSGLLSVGGVMSLGSGAITHDGTGSVYLLADNVYSGLTRVSGNGTLRVGSSGALGATSSGVEVIGSGVLELTGGISVLGESLSLAGYGNGVVGGFRNVSGTNVWSGTVSLTGNSGLGSGSGKLSLTGSPAIAASSFGVKIYGVVGSSVELVGEALYTGQTELVSGSLLLGASERIADGSNVMFNGGDLSTGGYSETVGELSLYTASSISLGVGVHALRFSGAGVYDFKMLTIKGWQGVYGTPGSSGTAGKVYVGTSAGLNRERLDQMRFYNATGPATHYCLQLSSGELVAGANITLVTAHSNIRITANATSNGSWSSVGNLVTFTTSADNANINATELQNYLRSFSVEIKTARAAGTQVGSVVFDVGVSADKNSSSAAALVFTITSGGEVQFNASLSLRNPNYSYNTGYNVVVTAGGNVRVGGVLDVSGYSNADGYNTFPSPGSVSMVVGGDLVVSGTGQVLSKGINNMYSSMNNANGGVGGLQSYVVSGGIDLQVGSVLNAGGGNGYITSYYNTTGGTGGSITLSAVNGVLMRGSVQSMGGNGYRGGTGGVLSVSSSSSWVDYSGVLSSQGGNGFNSGYQSGNGGNISISGFGGLSLRGDVNASVGSVGTGTSGGSISLSDGNGVLTSGGGVNDGLVGGVLKGVNVTKLGVGVFGLGGANAYTGSTTVSAGKIYLLQSESIPNVSALSLAASTELDMGGVSESVGSLAGSGKVTSSVTGSILLTVGSDNTTTSYSGILEDGLGVLRVTKAGTGTWSVSGVNTYSGLTQVLAGVLSIGNSSGLGAVSSGTEVTSGASLELYGGVSVGAEPLSLLGIGRSSIGALRNLSGVNAYAGAITVGTGVRVNVNGGSLNLTAGSVFTGTDASMLFGGSGLLSVGGVMSLGSGAITHDGTGSVYLLADNVYSGLTRVSGNGTLRVGSSGALGATSSGVEVIGSGVLELTGGISVLGESLSLAGYGNGVVGGFRNVSGTNVWSGTVSLTGNSGLGSGSGKLSLTGSPAIAASSFGVKIYGVVGSSVELVGEALYTGQTELVSGSLLLGASERIADGSNVMFNGGDLSTGGYTETLGELSLYAASSISLGVGVHALRFSGAGVYDFKMLTIKGWQGVYGTPGSSGTAGKVYVGTSAGLNRERLDQTRFYNATGPATHYCLQLSSGELVAGANITLVTAHSNIRITANATSNGSWSSVGNLVTFTTSADNANINATELQNYLRSFSVEIKTARAAGTQVGSVVFDTPVSVDKNVSGSSALLFTLNCGGDVLFNNAFSLKNLSYPEYTGYQFLVNAGGSVRIGGVLDLSGNTNNGQNLNQAPNYIRMVVGGDLVMSGTGQVLTMGYSKGLGSSYNAAGPGGDQIYTIGGGIELATGSVLNASGGAFPSSGSYTLGGTGGTVTLNAVNRVNLNGSIFSRGGNAYQGGTGGSLTISSSGGNLDYRGTLITQGGDGYNASATSGRGGPISLTGAGGLSIRNDINASNGSIGVNNSGGASVILSTDNPVITTGGGVNDGQVSGVIRAVQLDKRGSGALSMAGANAYSTFTHLTAGGIVLNSPAAIPVTSTVIFYDQNAVLDLHGYNLTLYGLGGNVGKVTNSSPDEVTLTIAHGGGNRFSGLIEDGNGRLNLIKSGTGTTFFENRVHTYSGTTNITGGALQIQFGATLGSTVGETIVNGGQLQLWYSTVTGEAITLHSAPATGALNATRGNCQWNGTINLGSASSIYVSDYGTSLAITPTSGPAIQGTNTNLTLYTIGNLTINGEIATGNATLTKSEAGILTLNGANSYNGLTTLNTGQTIIKNALGLGSNLAGTVLGSTANLTLDGALDVTGETLTMSSNAITANGSLLTKNGASSWSGDMTLSGSSVNWNNESDLTVTGNISNAATQWTVGRTAATTGNLVINGIISGIGALEKTGSGMLTLNAANTYTGLTKISAGALKLGATNAIKNTNALNLNGGELQTNGFDQTLANLNISANSSIVLGAATPHALRVNTLGDFYFRMLKIYGWEGDFSAGTSGTAGQIFFGNSSTLNQEKKDQIRFYNSALAKFAPLHLSNGEVVPNGTANASTGKANVRISNEPTINGVWTLVGNINTFNPNDENANINSGDLNLLAGKFAADKSVVINSNLAGASQAGIVIVDEAVNPTFNTTAVRNFTINAGNDLQVNQVINLASPSPSTLEGISLVLNSTGNINLNASVSTTPANISFAGTPKASGNITMSAAGYVKLGSGLSISARGVTNTYPSTAGRGANGGAISITGTGGLSLLGDVNAAGGGAYSNGSYVGTSMHVQFNTNAADLTVGGVNDGQLGKISGANVTLYGTGKYLFNGLNDYTGTTVVAGGSTLRLGAANVIPDLSAVTLLTTANVLELGDYTETVGSIAGAGNIQSYGLTSSVLNTGIDNTTTSYNGVISDGTGSVAVTKQGSGNWSLTKANTYSGLTTISAGKITMTHASALGSDAQGTVVANGAELDVQGNLTVGNEALTISGTGISSAGALRLVSGDASWAGPISTAAASRMVIAAGTWNQTGDVTLNQTLTTAVQGTSLKFAGILSGAGGITKSDVGFLELSGANSYSGAVSVAAGNLIIKHATALGTNTAGTTISAGANLTLDGGLSVLGETLSLSGSSATGNGALRSINGSNSWSGNVTLGGSLVYINAESGLEISGNILNNITSLTVGRTTGTGAANVLLSGIISGTGALEKTGTNELTLQGLNTYSGYTQVNGGSLKLGVSNAIPSNIFTLNGGELNVNGFNETLGTLNITANSSIRLGASTPHILQVTTLGTFYFRMLNIRGWEGVYNGGTPGTAGQIFMQNSNFLVRDKLDQIRFIDESNNNAKYAPLQLADGEIIPTGAANVLSGQVNIRISNEPTFNGAWTLAGSTNTFTANDDNANINYTELQTNLGSTNVVINSAFANGSQAGAVLFDEPIAVTNNNTTVRSFTVTASRDIHVNKSLAIGSTAPTTNRAPSVSFTAGQHIRINAALSVSPSTINTASNTIIASPTIAMVAGGNIYVASTGSVSTAGGANSSTSSAAFGGVGGALSLQAAGLSIAGNIAAAGGTSAYGTTNTGAGGNVTLQNTTLDFTENSGQTAGIISGASLIKNGVGILQLKGSNAYTAATSLNAGIIILGASESLPNTSAMTIASGATFDMAGWSETLAGLSGAGIIRSSLTGTSLLTFGSNNANTSFTGLIEDGAGILSLSKAGTGTFEPTYQNTYSGATTVTAGTWIASQASAFGSNAGGTSVLSGAVAQLKGPLNLGTENFTLAGAGISSNGALQVQTGNVTIGGTVTVGAVATSIKVESTGLNLNGDVTVPTGALTYLGTGTSQLNIAGNINAAVGQIVNGISETSISGIFSGSGSLTKRGLGNITLSNANTFSGAVSIEVGNLTLQHNQALGLGAGATTIAALSKLILPGGITVASEVLNLTGSASGVATLVSQGGANAWNGTINLSGTTNSILPESDLVIGGNVVNAGTILNVGLPTSTSTLRFNGIISGAGAFDKTGLSAVEFGAQNTYTGYTKIGAGVLRLAINESIPNAGLMYLDGGEFQTNGYAETIGTLHVTNHSQITLGSGAHVLTFSNMGDFNFRKLRINGWLGAYGSGTSGTDGQIFWGNSPFLIREKLDQIRFYNAAGPSTHYTTQLATGELVPLADITNVTGQSNIRISDEVRTNGAFVLASGIYTFTPSDDNAIINATELRGLLATNSVVINTASPTGTQYGSVLFDVDMLAFGTPTVSNTQTVNAGANIWINKNLNYSPVGVTGKGTSLIFRADKNISVLGTLTTNTLSSSSGTAISAAGAISLEATENLRIVSAISAIGGNNTSSTYGGNGGAILLKGLSGITMLANVSNNGGTSASGGVYNGIPGSVIVQTENTTQTTGGGVNDGQSAGVFNGLHLTKEGAGIFVLKGANTYTGNTTVNAGTLRLGASESITNTSILTVNASGTFEMKDFSETVHNIAGSGIIRNGGVATSLLTVGANNLASTYSGLLENGGGVLALTKNGTGILTLSNANTYSGATLLNAGGILATNNTALGNTTGATTVASGAVLQIQGGIQVAENVTISGTGISSLGALVFKSGDNIWQGNITTGLVATSIRVDAGNFTMQGTTTMGASLTVGGAGTSLTHVGNIVSTGTLTWDGAIAHTYAGQLSGTANVLKSGAGTVTLQGDNSFAGTMTVSAGSLILQHNNALGTVAGSSTVNSGASLVLDGGITVSGEALSLSGATATGTGALRSINGANSLTGAISTGGSSVYINAESDLSLTSISNSVILTLGSATGAGNIVVSGAISGAGSLEKTGSNRLTLNAANAYTGLTRLTAGAIHLGIAQAIPVASSFYFNGGTLVTNNYSNTLGMLYLTNNSVLDLGTTSAHTIVFSSISQLFDFKRLSITGWQGDYTNMTPGTMGRVKFTSSVSTYVLDQILFESPTPTYHYANMITDGSFEIVPGANMIVNPTSYSNVILSTATPSNGVWSALVGGVYTFTPNTDNAILNVTEVQTKLATGDVAVVTSNGSGTQSGAIIVVGALSASNATAAARKLTLTARGTVNVYAGMTLGSTTAAVAYPGIEAYFESLTGDVTVSSAGFITTSAGNLTGNVSASRAGNAGNITLKAVGGIMLNGALTATGGNNASSFANSGGGNGGNITLIGPLGITANANITSQAGTNLLNAFPGILTVETDALPDANGQNLGQTSTSLLKAGGFVKNGSGTFLLRNYSYGGFTTGGVANQTPLLSINAGTLKLTTATSIWDFADVSVASGAVWDMGGLSETVGSIAGSGTIRNGSTLTLSYNNPSLTTVFAGTMEGGLALVKSGLTGILELSSANTYTGLTTISQGIIRLKHANGLGATSAGTVVSDGASLQLDGGITSAAEPLTLNGTGGGLGALRNMSGTNTYAGAISLGTPAVRVNSDAGVLSISGTVANSIGLTFGGVAAHDVSGSISGTSFVTKDGTGSLLLRGNNSYAGLTTVSVGKLFVESGNALGSTATGTTVTSGASLQLRGGVTMVVEPLTINGSMVSGDGALASTAGINTWTGPVTLGSAAVLSADADELRISGSVSNPGFLLKSGKVAALGNVKISGIISGAGMVEKIGDGLLTLSGNNTYAGFTKVTSGILTLGANEVLPNSSAFYFNGGTLSTAGFTETTGVVHISDNSRLLFASGVHRVTFSLPGTFSAGKLLTVNGWEGDFSIPAAGQRPNVEDTGMLQTSSSRYVTINGVLRSAGGINQYGQINFTGFPGTAGKLFINTRLTLPMLEQIKFVNDADSSLHFSVQLGSNEIVPDYTR